MSPAALDRLALIAEAVRAHSATVAERDEPFFEAAVALILRAAAGGTVEALFIQRAARDNDPWSGQIALPGGRRHAGDASLEATAMRETLEEVGVDLGRDGVMLGALDELRPRTPVLPPVVVRPFVATLAPGVVAEARDEVAALFWAPLDAILDPASTRDADIVVRGLTMRRPALHYDSHVIWGMTERILQNFREVTR